jgi:peptidoglycan/xylan/chitin deacetylase (PgdA/CDA1 family)
MSTRDLRGYSGRSADIVWPNGARLAASIVVNFEEGAELQVGDGDATNEPVGEVMSVVAAHERDRGQEQLFAYGPRAGLWRMLEALDDAQVPATFFFCGRAVERLPDVARTIVERGHEPAVHGWRWRPHADYGAARDEGEDLDRCVEAIERATGARPYGFFCRGSESAWTRDLLIERGFVYTSNAFDDDLPYMHVNEETRAPSNLVVVPYALDTNDMKFFHPNGFVLASDMIEYVDDALDTLLAEAERGLPRLLNLGFHLRICGRPARFPAFSGILERLTEREDIWVASRIDIARAFRAATSGV